MKKHLLFTLLVLLTICQAAFSQVINGTYNVQVQFMQGYGRINTSEGETEPTWIAKAAEDTDNTATQLLNYTLGADNEANGAFCYAYYNATSDFWGPIVIGEMGSFLNSSTGRFDWDVMYFEDDNVHGSRCKFENEDDSGGYARNSFNLTGDEILWTEHEQYVTDLNKFKFRYTWRFSKGDDAYNALDFGDLTGLSNNSARDHYNSNRAAPSGATSGMGYTNYWSSNFPGTHNYTDGRDVVYEFDRTKSKTVTITTDFSGYTDFDTYIHLINLSEDGSTSSYIVGNDDIVPGSNLRSEIIRDLCPGNYAVVKEQQAPSCTLNPLQIPNKKPTKPSC